MYFPPDFDLAIARRCAKLTDVAYDMYTQWVAAGKPRKEEGFHWKAPAEPGVAFSSPIWSHERLLWIFDEAEPFGFVARDEDGTGHLVFRGTDSVSDWIADAEAGQKPYPFVPDFGGVHEGFLALYASMRDDVMRAFDQVGTLGALRVTGHSLGCGLSTLAVPDLVKGAGLPVARHYNFASPRVGDTPFADAYQECGVPTYRVVNTCDIVPTVPPSVLGHDLYQHVGVPVDFTAQHGSLAGNHSLAKCYIPALESA